MVGRFSKHNNFSRNETYCFPIAYRIFKGDEWKFKIEEETNCFINKAWLKNPYEYDFDNCLKSKEITEEEYNIVKEEFNKAQEIFNNLSQIYTI